MRANILVCAPLAAHKNYSFEIWRRWLDEQPYDNIDVAVCINGKGKLEYRREIETTQVKGKDIHVSVLADDQDLTFKHRMNNARDYLRAYARLRGYSYVLWLDTDTIPVVQDAIQTLLNHDKEIVSGLYFYKNTTQPVAIDMDGGRNIALEKLRDKATNNELIEVMAFGLGCCLVKNEALDTRFDYYRFKETHGEDFGWCDAQRNTAKRTLYLDARVLCKHLDENETEQLMQQLRQEQ